MTEEVPCERSRVSGRNSSNAEEELSRNFQIPLLSQGTSSVIVLYTRRADEEMASSFGSEFVLFGAIFI